MLTLITGVPGSGKTAGAVDLILKEYQGRPLYVDGLADLKLDHTPVDVMAWPSDVPDGAVVVVDEVQRKWRPRGPGSKVPESVAALETHRHRGLDFVIITQNPRLVDANVRALIGRHVHIRDTGFMGRWAYEWPECNADLAWAKCQNKRRYKLPKRVFDLYTSASMHTKPVRKVPPLLYIVGALLIGVALLLYFLRSGMAEPEKPLPAALPPSAASTPSLSQDAVQKPAFIDDRVDFIPRVSDKPESAPAYDAIRVIVNMPQVTGGACFKGACKCYTQQGTDSGLTHDACKSWMANPTFDHYRLAPPPPATGVASVRGGSPSAGTPSPGEKTASAPVQTVSVVPMPDGVSNPRADARPPSMLPPGSPVHTTPATGAVRPIAPPNLLNPYRVS